MSTPTRPLLKSITPTPAGPDAAPQPVETAAVGVPKVAARKGVPIAVGVDPTPESPGIRIYAPPVYRHHYDGARWSKRYSDTPTAAYACPCGHTTTATGQQAVADLVADYAAHKHFCTGTPAALTERRTAA
ncbi:hypothetical protein [Streptomyces asoensis]|uniref:Uncharacterized protein n=1 Tax=Streptomyces asoensis TaxID=249586 RepID=A0ABQ3S3Q2_9ACTN|nr:hypothetical protein [Streptomyces asoensis]GGQ82011.1 hypothetical protein GCM10010496_52010 [Streptomyces asoensis]GHI62742.1 hypothetical protein Saso_43920 [Streptomyces asoensis]